MIGQTHSRYAGLALLRKLEESTNVSGWTPIWLTNSRQSVGLLTMAMLAFYSFQTSAMVEYYWCCARLEFGVEILRGSTWFSFIFSAYYAHTFKGTWKWLYAGSLLWAPNRSRNGTVRGCDSWNTESPRSYPGTPRLSVSAHSTSSTRVLEAPHGPWLIVWVLQEQVEFSVNFSHLTAINILISSCKLKIIITDSFKEQLCGDARA